MHLCTSMNEEGGEVEDVFSETPSVLTYTLRYVSFAEVPTRDGPPPTSHTTFINNVNM